MTSERNEKKLSSPSRDYTTTFPININHFMVSWTVLSKWCTLSRSLAYISVLDINNGLSWLIDHKSTWWPMLLLQSLTPMTRTLHYVTVTRMFAMYPWYVFPIMRSETYVLEDLLKFWRLYAPCMPWTPLVVLFQSALAMYSFLNLMKSVVASLCRQPRSLYVVQKLRHFHRAHALVSVFQQSSDY